MYAIETVGLTKIFGSTKAVDNVNLKVRSGTIFGLLGPNGAGKTTTIRMILGLLKPTKGYVKIFGINVERNRKEVLRIAGYMPQRFSLYEDLTVEENIKLYASLYGMSRSEAEKRTKELIEEFILGEYRDRLAGKLSGGTKQRLALAVSLVHRPKLLIVDEPTAGVDPPLRRYFWEKFRQLKEAGVTILVTTHYMDEAENCDKLALMSRGRIIAEGTPLEIKRLAFGGDIIAVELVYNGKLSLDTLDGVRRVIREEYTDGLYKAELLVDDASVRLAEIVETLRGLGAEIRRAYQVQVSLEDAFIKLTG